MAKSVFSPSTGAQQRSTSAVIYSSRSWLRSVNFRVAKIHRIFKETIANSFILLGVLTMGEDHKIGKWEKNTPCPFSITFMRSRGINYGQSKHIHMKGSRDTQTGSGSHIKLWAGGAT